MIATTLFLEAGDVAQWVWRTSLEASLLIAVVFLIGWAAGGKLPPRWRYVLGLLILARLVLPITLPGTWGFSRLVPDDISEPRWTQGYDTMEQSEQEVVPAPVIVKSPSVPEQVPADPPARRGASWSLTGLWVVGVLLVFGVTVARMIRFTIRVRGAVPVVRADSRELLDHCRASLGVTRAIALLEMEGLGTPALYGVFRPRLLLPYGFLDRFSPREVRLVFLHELAHLRAHDILLNWLIALAGAIHWFNPVTWLALRRLRQDREILRDFQVLHRLDATERATYGQTLLKLSEQLSGGVPCPSFIPVINHRSQITRRIVMITRYRRESRASNIGLAAAVTLLALATFTRTNSFGAELSAEMTTLPYALNAEKAGAPVQIAGAERTEYQLAGILEVSRQDNAWPVEEKVAFRVRVSGHQYNVRTETANGWAEAGFNGKESIFIKSLKYENELAHANFSKLPPGVQLAFRGPGQDSTKLKPADLFVALNHGIVPRCKPDASLPVVWLATASAGYFETAAPSRILKMYDMSRGGPVVPLDYVLMDGQPGLPRSIVFYDRRVPGPGPAIRQPLPFDTNAGSAQQVITPRGFARHWPIPFCTNGVFAVEETTNVFGLTLPLRFRLTVFNQMSTEETDTPAPIPDGSYIGFVTNVAALSAKAMLPTLPEGEPMQFSDARLEGGPYSYTTNRLLSEAEVRATSDYRSTHQVEQSGEQLQLRSFRP